MSKLLLFGRWLNKTRLIPVFWCATNILVNVIDDRHFADLTSLDGILPWRSGHCARERRSYADERLARWSSFTKRVSEEKGRTVLSSAGNVTTGSGRELRLHGNNCHFRLWKCSEVERCFWTFCNARKPPWKCFSCFTEISKMDLILLFRAYTGHLESCLLPTILFRIIDWSSTKVVVNCDIVMTWKE